MLIEIIKVKEWEILMVIINENGNYPLNNSLINNIFNNIQNSSNGVIKF